MNKPTGTGFRPVPRKLALLVAAALTSGSTFAGTEPMALRSLSALPISFERNDGQLRPDILFLARGVAGEVAVRHGEIAIAPRRPLRREGRAILSDEGKTLGVRLAGADPRPVIETREPLATVSHRYEGSSKWENIPHYGRIVMRNVYTDIDLAVHGSEGSLEYDFIVSPGANPSDIRLKLDADRVTLDEVGDLVLQVGGDTLRQRAPVAYQERDGERIVVAARFDLQGTPGAAEAGFILGDYDPALPLVIDPVIGYSTYLGGSGNETGGFVKVDADENVYVAYTSGSGTATAVSVTKFNPNTNSHYFTTTLDGASYEVVNALAIGASGAGVASYITGYTASSNFPHCLGGSGAADCSVYGEIGRAHV